MFKSTPIFEEANTGLMGSLFLVLHSTRATGYCQPARPHLWTRCSQVFGQPPSWYQETTRTEPACAGYAAFLKHEAEELITAPQQHRIAQHQPRKEAKNFVSVNVGPWMAFSFSNRKPPSWKPGATVTGGLPTCFTPRHLVKIRLLCCNVPFTALKGLL